MKIYLVLSGHNYEGYSPPIKEYSDDGDSVFLNKKDAETEVARRKRAKYPYDYDNIFELEVKE